MICSNLELRMGRRRTGRREHIGAVVVSAAREESVSLGELIACHYSVKWLNSIGILEV
jgi:hypothetical protein